MQCLDAPDPWRSSTGIARRLRRRPHLARCFLPVVLVAAVLPGAAASQAKLAEAETAVTEKLVVHRAERPVFTVYEWVDGLGGRFTAWAGDGQTPPSYATRIQARVFSFPTGQLRELTFQKHTQISPNHVIVCDDVTYAVSGHYVQFINEDGVIDNRAGDVALHPTGVHHNSIALEAGTRLEFAFDPKPGIGKTAVAMPRTATPLRPAVETVSQGVRHVTFASESQGHGEGRFAERVFSLPGYILVEAHYPRGERAPAFRVSGERIVYVLEGRLKISTGAEDAEVVQGDSYREVAGQMMQREALEDTTTVEINASSAPTNVLPK